MRFHASALAFVKAVQLGRIQAEETRLSREILFYVHVTWKWQDKAWLRRTPPPRELSDASLASLRMAKQLWVGRWLLAKHYALSNPWSRLLAETYDYRQCIIGDESRTTGVYKAENGGTRYAEGPGNSNASGAYQFLDSTWQTRFAAAKAYFGGKLTGNWTHAADAPPKVQDIVAAYAIVADKAVDWTECYSVGLHPPAYLSV